MNHGGGEHGNAGHLMEQRTRQRRLMQERDNADTGLQCDDAGQRQRAVEDSIWRH